MLRRLVITSEESSRNSADLLSGRISELGERWTAGVGAGAADLRRTPAALSGRRFDAYARSAALAEAMALWNPGRAEFERPTDLTPAAADKLVAMSRELLEMAVCEPALADEPLQRDCQHWVGDGTHVPVVPRKEFCVLPSVGSGQLGVPAFWSAFYTSTAMSSGYSMWRALMSCQGIDAFDRKLPWHTWRMVVDDGVRVAEVRNAASWVDLVSSYGVVENGVLSPDWVKLALAFDAIHFTWPLIVASQGLAFATDRGVMARSYWDVECTLWLHWRFKGAHVAEKFIAT